MKYINSNENNICIVLVDKDVNSEEFKFIEDIKNNSIYIEINKYQSIDIENIVESINNYIKDLSLNQTITIVGIFEMCNTVLKITETNLNFKNIVLICPSSDIYEQKIKDKNIYMISGINERGQEYVEKFYNNNKKINNILYHKINDLFREENLIIKNDNIISKEINKILKNNIDLGEKLYIGEKLDPTVVFITEVDNLLEPLFLNKIINIKEIKNYVPHTYLSLKVFLQEIEKYKEKKIIYIPKKNIYLTNKEINNDKSYFCYDEITIEKVN
ncbi:MAG: hypothetical protein ACK5HR_03935, partial [Mycoplasmatales bacterium]